MTMMPLPANPQTLSSVGADPIQFPTLSPVPIRWSKLHPDAVEPFKTHPTDVGYDMVATSREFLVKNGVPFVKYGTGIGVDIPDDWQLAIRPRSSIYKYHLVLANSVGTIDPDYKHREIFFMFKLAEPFSGTAQETVHTSIEPDGSVSLTTVRSVKRNYHVYSVGDRVGQAVLMPRYTIDFEEVDNYSVGERGGFGSTGT